MVDQDGQISEAELAAFADGSPSPTRRAQVAACFERSPELHVPVGAQRAAPARPGWHATGTRAEELAA